MTSIAQKFAEEVDDDALDDKTKYYFVFNQEKSASKRRLDRDVQTEHAETTLSTRPKPRHTTA